MAQKGFYLYAVREAMQRDTFPEIMGIDNASVAFPLLVGDRIEAIVSRIRLNEFGTEEISEKALNDLRWIKEKSVIHNQVVMESSEGCEAVVIPMKFGLIFKDKKSLGEAIKKDSPKFLRLFQKFKGKEEWSVKVFAGPTVLKEAIIESDPVLCGKKKEIDSLPVGLAYFKEIELADELEKRKSGELHRLSQEIFNIFHQFVDDAKLGKILGKELTMRAEPMILNAILLINKKKLNKFLKEAKKVRRKLEKKGLLIDIAGPWPPYSFVE